MTVRGTLYLIPSPLSDSAPDAALPQHALEIVRRLGVFVVENAKSARATLKRYGYALPLAQAQWIEYNEHSGRAELALAMAPLLSGDEVGLLSEAGCPGVADPGADLVRSAHQQGIRVVAFAGPSSILLALMASGLNGQRFAFLGYLPVPRGERAEAIRALETRSAAQSETQIFIETPYRSDALLQALVETCRADTLLCVASDLTGAEEQVRTRTVREWRAAHAALPRMPSIFLLLAARH